MTIEQITAINNSISMLKNIGETASCMESVEKFKEYTNEYIKTLKDSKVDNQIIEHIESIIVSYIPVAQRAEEEYKQYQQVCEEMYELNKYFHNN